MTPRKHNEHRTAAMVVTTAVAAGMVVAPGIAAADGCGGDPLDTAFCAVDQALSFDPFTLLDEARELSDRGREFGQQLNENNQQFYHEYVDYPSRTQLAQEFAEDQAAGLEDDRAAIDAAVSAATDHATQRAEEARQEAMDRAAEEQRRADERVAASHSDAEEVREEAEETTDETQGDADQQVQDQVEYRSEPIENWRRNTEEDVRDFGEDVSPVGVPSTPSAPSKPAGSSGGGTGTGGSGGSTSPGAGGVTAAVQDVVDEVTATVTELLP